MSHPTRPSARISVVTTLRDERDSVGALLSSLLGQTRRPDEIVVADGGSTDGTREYLAAVAEREPTVVLTDAPGSRSRGRNHAIARASNDLIACIDGGCVAEPRWLEQLAAAHADGAPWVAGFYRPDGATVRSTCAGLAIVPVREEVDPATFLPSARSMAFERRLWREVGGFPEHLDYAEDTWFGEELLSAGHRPRFVAEAVVRWTPPTGYLALARTTYRYGRGDGLAGLRDWTYRRLLLAQVTTVGLTAAAAALHPATVPLALIPYATLISRLIRRKLAQVPGPTGYVHLPLAQAVALAASTAGYLRGRLALGRSSHTLSPSRLPT